jgi:alpha-mannosidase
MGIREYLHRIGEHGGGSYASLRAVAELDYLWRLLRSSEAAIPGNDSVAVEEAAARLASAASSRGGLSSDDVAVMEGALAAFSGRCKSLALHCVGHAHIDMNWMWGYHETVAVTLDTMRTVLGLMERYPEFRFSQSQASVYRIVEHYDPSLVEPVSARIAEGRWESLACQWVETDMVLPSGESLVRQMLYARRYMMEAFGAPESSFETVFLPDTFGYSASTPELLASAGVKRLYHCRGAEDRIVYRWIARSGRSILAYRDPRWYNTAIDSTIARFLPAFARDTGLSSALCLYGVGDHGGGPTMRDIERLRDMATWPLFPKIAFCDMRGYFEAIAGSEAKLPAFSGEPDRIFTGCYASQSRIKEANARAQEALYEAELLTATASVLAGAGTPAMYVRENLREAWVDVLFGQFHDTLPGSGVRETRERALGLFQGAMASALTCASHSLRALANRGRSAGAEGSGPPALVPEERFSAWLAPRSEGAGAGFGAELYRASSASRSSETDVRRFFLFNQLQWSREECVELVLWDWGEPSCAAFYDESGARLPSQLVETSKEPYWGHEYAKYLVAVEMEGFGFASIEARDSGEEPTLSDYHPYGSADWLVERPRSYVLENASLRVVFDGTGMGIESLVDKRTGEDLVVGKGPTGSFRLIEEDAPKMTAWIVGRRRRVRTLDDATTVLAAHTGQDLLEQWIEYGVDLPTLPGSIPSSLKVRISLAKGGARLGFEATCDWREPGSPDRIVRQLDFAVALAGEIDCAIRDIPFGVARSGSSERDEPATSFMAAFRAGSSCVQLTAPGKQSFRFEDGVLSVTLLRASTDPDPYPEIGQHRFSFALSLHDPATGPEALVRESLEIRHRVLSLAKGARGTRGLSSLLKIEGDGVVVAALKLAEAEGWTMGEERIGETRTVLRLYETCGSRTCASVSGSRILGWRVLDSHERGQGMSSAPSRDGRIELSLEPFGVVTVELTFDVSDI